MKRFICHLLILLLLMPSMACAMPVCAKGQKAEAVQHLPCHGHENTQVKQDGHDHSKTSGKVKFLKDCMGVDFQAAADGPVLKQPDVSHDINWAMVFVMPTTPFSNLGKVAAIRGPPPDWPDVQSIYPPVYLTTQRLRI